MNYTITVGVNAELMGRLNELHYYLWEEGK